MRKLTLCTLGFLLAGFAVPTVAADDCNCTIVPFEPRPPCDSICPTRILTLSKQRELVSILGLKPNLAAKVVKAAEPNSVKPEFTAAERKEIQNRFQLLNQAKVDTWMATLPAGLLKDVKPDDASLKGMQAYQELINPDKTLN